MQDCTPKILFGMQDYIRIRTTDTFTFHSSRTNRCGFIAKRRPIVIGISKDSVNSHLNFATKYNLPFILLSDSELSAIKAYGVWQEKKLYGKVSMGVVRTTFLIDEQGTVQAVMPKVKPDTNADEILALLKE